MFRTARRTRWRNSALAAALALVGVMPAAHAKAAYDSPYGFAQTWTCAVRLVRVDLGFKITEKDEQSGYLLFEYRSTESGAKTTPGSIELVRGEAAEAPVHVAVQLPQMPRYHEQVLLDAFVRKLRQEYGEPPVKRAPPPPDAGAPGQEDKPGR